MDLHQAAGAKSLSRLPKFGTGVGLCRCRHLFGSLYAMPECSRLDTIRVTGSNGKGSVTALVHAILTALGLRVGRYTSPHLLRFNERIVIGSREITDVELDEGYRWFKRESAQVVAALPGERSPLSGGDGHRVSRFCNMAWKWPWWRRASAGA